ncbi:hypothetical protein ACWCV4_36260, partial [Streptomyces yangpuensis]
VGRRPRSCSIASQDFAMSRRSSWRRRGAAPADGGPGTRAGPGAGSGGGQGLIGLAERARLAGGELTALPADGGFRVHAWLPWQR